MNLEKIKLGDGAHHVFVFKATGENAILFKLMDLVGGTAYGQCARLGKVLSDGNVTRVPPVPQLRLLQHWNLRIQIFQKAFHLKSIDGCAYGTSTRRMPALDRIYRGRLATWPRAKHSDFLAREVGPDKGVNITDYAKKGWEDVSFLLLYRTEAPVAPYLDECEIPNLDDWSHIEVWPEITRYRSRHS